jgi:hypothetical protein
MTGWTNKEAFGQPLDRVLSFVDPISGQPFHYYTTPMLHEGIIGTIPHDSFVISKNGTRLLVEESFATPMRDNRTEIRGAVIVLYPKTAIPVPGERAQDPGSAVYPGRELSIAFQNQQGHIREPSAPVDAAGWYDRGNYLLFLRRYEDAINAYDNAISMNAMNYQSWYGMGTALEKLGKTEEALLAYDEALSIYPRNTRILDAKGMLLKKSGRDGEAERCFELARIYLA